MGDAARAGGGQSSREALSEICRRAADAAETARQAAPAASQAPQAPQDELAASEGAPGALAGLPSAYRPRPRLRRGGSRPAEPAVRKTGGAERICLDSGTPWATRIDALRRALLRHLGGKPGQRRLIRAVTRELASGVRLMDDRALGTIATALGLKHRESVRRLVAAVEEAGLLLRIDRAGWQTDRGPTNALCAPAALPGLPLLPAAAYQRARKAARDPRAVQVLAAAGWKVQLERVVGRVGPGRPPTSPAAAAAGWLVLDGAAPASVPPAPAGPAVQPLGLDERDWRAEPAGGWAWRNYCDRIEREAVRAFGGRGRAGAAVETYLELLAQLRDRAAFVGRATISDLAAATGLSRRTVSRHLAKTVALGLVVRSDGGADAEGVEFVLPALLRGVAYLSPSERRRAAKALRAPPVARALLQGGAAGALLRVLGEAGEGVEGLVPPMTTWGASGFLASKSSVCRSFSQRPIDNPPEPPSAAVAVNNPAGEMPKERPTGRPVTQSTPAAPSLWLGPAPTSTGPSEASNDDEVGRDPPATETREARLERRRQRRELLSTLPPSERVEQLVRIRAEDTGIARMPEGLARNLALYRLRQRAKAEVAAFELRQPFAGSGPPRGRRRHSADARAAGRERDQIRSEMAIAMTPEERRNAQLAWDSEDAQLARESGRQPRWKRQARRLLLVDGLSVDEVLQRMVDEGLDVDYQLTRLYLQRVLRGRGSSS